MIRPFYRLNFEDSAESTVCALMCVCVRVHGVVYPLLLAMFPVHRQLLIEERNTIALRDADKQRWFSFRCRGG